MYNEILGRPLARVVVRRVFPSAFILSPVSLADGLSYGSTVTLILSYLETTL